MRCPCPPVKLTSSDSYARRWTQRRCTRPLPRSSRPWVEMLLRQHDCDAAQYGGRCVRGARWTPWERWKSSRPLPDAVSILSGGNSTSRHDCGFERDGGRWLVDYPDQRSCSTRKSTTNPPRKTNQQIGRKWETEQVPQRGSKNHIK